MHAVSGTQTKAPRTPQIVVQKVSANNTVTGCKFKELAKTRGSTKLPTRLCTSSGQARQIAAVRKDCAGSKTTKTMGAAVETEEPKGMKFNTKVSIVQMIHKSTRNRAKRPPMRKALITDSQNFPLMYARIWRRSRPSNVDVDATASVCRSSFWPDAAAATWIKSLRCPVLHGSLPSRRALARSMRKKPRKSSTSKPPERMLIDWSRISKPRASMIIGTACSTAASKSLMPTRASAARASCMRELCRYLFQSTDSTLATTQAATAPNNPTTPMTTTTTTSSQYAAPITLSKTLRQSTADHRPAPGACTCSTIKRPSGVMVPRSPGRRFCGVATRTKASTRKNTKGSSNTAKPDAINNGKKTPASMYKLISTPIQPKVT
mmetsp:Transcript_8615/g.24804  ORF Transcript_8615/g.24804 Transcript_8615/m.24804 type:complete len:378 (+) Transcript_8615:202-1335(+)